MENSMYKITREIINEVVFHMIAKEKCDGVKSGFRALDYLIDGFGKGQLIIIGAVAGMGKTTFACSVVDNVCVKEKKACFYFSPAASKESIVQRLIRIHGDIKYNDKDLESISTSANEIVDSPLWIDDSPAIHIDEIIQKCREVHKIRALDLIVVDYLQLLSDEVKKENGTLAEQKRIVGKLKSLAEELQCPILLLSQLNDSAFKRKRHVPIAADFPVHEVLDKYADVILILYREYYYYMNEDMRDQAKLIVVRSKNNSCIGTHLRFDSDIPKFREWR